MKTVSQIAKELGVTRQAVHIKIKQEPLSKALQGLSSSVGNTLQFTDEGERLIKAAFDKNRTSKALTKSLDETVKLIASLQGQVDTLTELVTGQQKLLSEQQRSIHDLTSALSNTTESLKAAQALHAGSMHQQLTDGENEQPRKKKRGWFGRK